VAVTGAIVRFMLEGFGMSILRTMELTKILNHCYPRRGFVDDHSRFSPDKKSIEVRLRPRKGAKAGCSGCDKPAPGYDRLEPRGKEGSRGGWSRMDLESCQSTFPGAVQIVDLYDACQHLWELARRLHPNDATG
jgi:hypothetical protein